MIDRRTALIVALCWPVASRMVFAQSQAKPHKIGILGASTQEATQAFEEVFIRRLRELGHAEGKNLVIERRYSGGDNTLLPALARELVGREVDVILAPATPAALAARTASRTIPIVFVTAADPVGVGLVESLARPNGNATGLSSVNVELIGKRLSLLKELVPKAARMGILCNPANPPDALQIRDASAAAKALGITVQVVRATAEADYAQAFAGIVAQRIDALYVIPNPPNLSYRRLIIELAAKTRVPVLYGAREFPEEGGLLSYATSSTGAYARAAYYVDRILKATRPADLPVEQPTTFELVINRKTARALGINIPQSMLLRANELIE